MKAPFLFTKASKTRKCERCGMRYKAAFEACPHCKDIPDGPALEQHIQRYQDRLQANMRLGYIFLAIMAALLAFVGILLIT